jgi:hypothetical protein
MNTPSYLRLYVLICNNDDQSDISVQIHIHVQCRDLLTSLARLPVITSLLEAKFVDERKGKKATKRSCHLFTSEEKYK